MSDSSKNKPEHALLKVVYFDEQSASDYLDITAGGKAVSRSEHIRKRTSETQAKVEAKVAAKLSWLPFVGVSTEVGGGSGFARAGQSILSKTLSNTILTDYLEKIEGDLRIQRLSGFRVRASKDSMAYIKMYTPYLGFLRTEDQGADLAKLDDALATAKGYYEMVGVDGAGSKCVLRFNIEAFRNNYGLSDLGRMNLVYHGMKVGDTTESGLTIEAEMSGQSSQPGPVTARTVVDGVAAESHEPKLDVYDVILAGVEHE